ncbi:hypothetical protein IWW37_001255 [Coemansia sp. RSA 2050]|nr:hypothetical protein IWW37_001255 [Coemansia sp. RSA 2050]KAJ2736872.1 hypothetical protein IW152_000383 [Coemansia sp. BCRC 34962]
MAMRTPPRASVERELVRVTPTPAPRYRPSYIPLPTPLSTPSTSNNSNSAVNVRGGLQHRPSESGGSRTSGDDTRTGRSSSLSARTSSPALASTGIPAPSRPSFNLYESATSNGHHQRSNSSVDGILDSRFSSGLGMDQSRLSSVDGILDSGRNSALGGNSSCVVDEAVDDSERILPVKVAVRIRPLVVGSGGSEQQQAGGGRGSLTSCLEAVAGGTIAVSGSSSSVVGALADSGAAAQRAFHFDYAFGPEAGQAAVYDAAVAPLLQRFVEGYNVTVLAYGQTSSGKTYTMGTESDDGSGVVPRALRWLFAWWAGQDAGRRGSVRISFLEVYNDELIDLVAQTQGRGVRRPVFVREDAKGHVVWTGVKEVAVTDADAALAVLADGSRERQTGGTRMNDKSSRSHAIYSVTLAQARTVSKLHFVDLAGSERLKKTLAVGERQREGIAINSGLLALGNVISALGDPPRGAPSFVPYRDSKLTHMLRDSLGGSAQTLLIACVSQAESNVAESLNTLKYAARARNIRNRGGVNVVATRTASREVEALRAVVRRLRAEVSELSERLQGNESERLQGSELGSSEQGGERLLGSERLQGGERLLGSSSRAGSRLALSPPTKIPTMGAALQKRADEASALRARNQALEGELEQLNDTYTELLLRFNDACREIEDRQSEGFERDQKLRDREQEIRRLTAHSRRATADSARQSRRLGVEPGEPAELPQLPDLARLRLLRSETADRAGACDAPGAAEFDAILEECDANVRVLEGELRAAHDALAALRLQLDMHETRASFAEKLTASQVAQIDALRAQLEKARDAGVAEEERRRAVEAELEDALLAYDAQLEAVASEWRSELQHVDEQWNERWDAAGAEHAAQIEQVERAAEAKAHRLESELGGLRMEHEKELARLRASLEQALAEARLSHGQELSSLAASHGQALSSLAASHEHELGSLIASHVQELATARLSQVDTAPPVVTQLLSPPPTASDDDSSNAARVGLYAELERSAASRLEAEAEAEAEKSARLEDETERLRVRAQEAELRASAAEAALAAVTAKLAAAKEEELAAPQPMAVRSLSSELPRRTSDRIILCARNSMAHNSADAAEVTPSELRLRNVRHRYSSVAPAHSQLPQPDRFASYPELRLASSLREAPGHAPPVYDEDQIQRMLRDAAAEVDDSGVFAESQERRDLLAELALLKETKKDLQERNSQMKNLMRDLGDRLVGLAEENDQLEVKANERDQLFAEVQRLTQALAKLEDSAADDATSNHRRMSIDSFRSADTTNAMEQLQTRLELAEADLAAAMVSVEEHQSHVAELMHGADVFRRRIQDLDDDLAQTMRQLDDAREDSRRLEQLARAHADADSEIKRQRTLVACLQESLAASEETAEESKLASDRYANELMRVQAESRAVVEQVDELQRMLQDARAMVASEARDRDVWKSRCQDLREEVDELRVRRRQNKILCF